MTFKERLSNRALLRGTFLKTPSPILVEVLASVGLDCLCLDAEHAPFDRGALDLCIMAARANSLPVLVRPQSSAAEHILNALDCGADGVLLPHIRSAHEALLAVGHATYGPGGRGYAGSSRAAGYGTIALADHRRATQARTITIVQIEDIGALDEIDGIVATPGLDAVFVGRIDLTVALDAVSPDAPEVVDAVSRIVSAARAAGLPSGMFVPRDADVAHWHAAGATLFLQGSDHSFIRAGAAAMLAATMP